MGSLRRPLRALLSRVQDGQSTTTATTTPASNDTDGWTCSKCRGQRPLPRSVLWGQRQQLPLRTLVGGANASRKIQTRRTFSTTTSRLEGEDHYATLGVAPSATSAEIKKAFYKLSKTYHPDHNPNNQEEASRKFVAASDAYAVLGDATKRQRYDRERQPASARGVAPQYGSYSSGQAGGRTASGLSRRRGQFRGPPPSFYRSGGWGAAAEKRRANASGASGNADDSFSRQQQGGGAGPNNTAGPAPGDSSSKDDWPFSAPNDVPHFDRGRHYRRTTAVDEQLRQGRQRRRATVAASNEQQQQRQRAEEVGAGTEFRSFALVGGVIAVGIGVPVLFMGRSSSTTGSQGGSSSKRQTA